MAKKKNSSHNLLKYLLVVPAIFNLASHFLSLVKYEAIVMRHKITCLLVVGIFCLMFLSAMWAAILALLTLYLISLNIGVLLSITLILLLNFFLFIIGLLSMIIIKRNMAFPETREAIKEIISEP